MSYLILVLKIGGELYTWDSIRFGSYDHTGNWKLDHTVDKLHDLVLEKYHIIARLVLYPVFLYVSGFQCKSWTVSEKFSIILVISID